MKVINNNLNSLTNEKIKKKKLKNKFLISNAFLQNFFFRFDLNFSHNMLNMSYNINILFLFFLNYFFSNFSTLKKKKIVNIFFFFFLNNYKYSRHISLLPTNGQKTQSNKQTAKKNTLLKNFIVTKNIKI